ncbi:ABC transporter ATP-binding protein [Erysipelothrix aquatica]|uniref:ABC transporter ATP-binding protein n=1 Tax=Erysipelothrix aquatica TaxID=2683714 RepID=UPI00135C4A74|nr:ABC transporter ATP-binding protein [Erysipelothrix aquatica]
MSSKRIVSVQNLNKTFVNQANETITALKDINFEINSQEFVSIIGPSGCGKSTLLRIVSQLETYNSGNIEYFTDGPIADNIGFVFQESVLFPWKSVYKNAIFPLKVKNMMTDAHLQYVDHLLKTTGLEKFKNSLPKELSGGMKQRVSIVRSLSYSPQLLLMDEPFGALDAITRDTLNLELARISREEKMTVVFVTHDIDEAVFLSSKVIVMSARPGEIKEIVDIDLPADRDLSIRADERFTTYAKHLRGLLNEDN